jgi:hypothetical protein
MPRRFWPLSRARDPALLDEPAFTFNLHRLLARRKRLGIETRLHIGLGFLALLLFVRSFRPVQHPKLVRSCSRFEDESIEPV